MIRSRRLFFAVLALAVTVAPLSAERGDGVEISREHGRRSPIEVDCGAGESLQAAIDSMPQYTGQITINISGFCAEPITIHRKVIIRGTNSATDGITGPSTGNNTALVAVYGVSDFWPAGAETVRLEHLSIKDSANIGLSDNYSEMGLDDVVIRDNVGIGLGAFPGSFVTATGLTVTDNGGGLLSQGRLSCTDCTLRDNGPASAAGAGADQAGKIFLINTSLAGTNGVQATSGGEVTMIGGSITAVQRAATIQNGGHVFFQSGTTLSGSVQCGVQGILDSRKGQGTAGFTQVSSPFPNLIQNGCVFLAGPGTTTLAGTTQVGAGSVTATEGGNTAIVRYGSLSCSNGGKVTTSGGQTYVNNVPGVPAGCAP